MSEINNTTFTNIPTFMNHTTRTPLAINICKTYIPDNFKDNKMFLTNKNIFSTSPHSTTSVRSRSFRRTTNRFSTGRNTQKKAKKEFGKFLLHEAKIKEFIKTKVNKTLEKCLSELLKYKEKCVKKRNDKNWIIENNIIALNFYEKKLSVKPLIVLKQKYTEKCIEKEKIFEINKKKIYRMKMGILTQWIRRFNNKNERRTNLYKATMFRKQKIMHKLLFGIQIYTKAKTNLRANIVSNPLCFQFITELYENAHFSKENATQSQKMVGNEKSKLYAKLLKITTNSNEYLWLNEGFLQQDSELLKKALSGFVKYSGLIYDFKYKHVYSLFKRIILNWKEYANKNRKRKINTEILQKKIRINLYEKVMNGLKKYWDNKMDYKKRVAIIKNRVYERKMKNMICYWENKSQKRFHTKIMRNNAILLYNKKAKRRTLLSLIRFLNARYTKYEIYGKNMQIYNKKLLKRIFKNWLKFIVLIKIYNKNYEEITNKKPINTKRNYWKIWKNKYEINKKSKEFRKKFIVKIQFEKLRKYSKFKKNHRENITKNLSKITQKITKKILIVLSKKTKEKLIFKQILENAKIKLIKKLKYHVLKGLVLHKNSEKFNKRNMQKAINLQTKRKFNKTIKSLKIYNSTKTKNNEKLAQFTVKRKIKIFTKFNEITRKLLKINKIGIQIYKNKCTSVIYSYFRNWTFILKKHMLKLCDLQTKYTSRLILKIFLAWKNKVARTIYLQNAKNSFKLTKTHNLLSNIISQWDKICKNPLKKLKEQSIRYYLNKTYKKCLDSIKIYSNNKKFIKNVCEYYIFRVQRQVLKKLTRFTKINIKLKKQKNAKKLAIYSKVMQIMKNNTEIAKFNKKQIFNAILHNENKIKHKIFNGFKENIQRNSLILQKIHQIHKNSENKQKLIILQIWKNYILRKSTNLNKYKEFSETQKYTQKQKYLQSWKIATQNSQKIRFATLIHNRFIGIRVFEKLELWNKLKKKSKSNLNIANKNYRKSLLQIVFIGLYTKYSKNKEISQKIQNNIKKITKNKKRIFLHILHEFTKITKISRNSIQNLSNIRRKFILRNYFNKYFFEISKMYRFQYKIIFSKQTQLFKQKQNYKKLIQFLSKLLTLAQAHQIIRQKLSKSLQNYTRSLSSKTLYGLRTNLINRKIHAQYTKIMFAFIKKKFLSKWQIAYKSFEEYRSIKHNS